MCVLLLWKLHFGSKYNKPVKKRLTFKLINSKFETNIEFTKKKNLNGRYVWYEFEYEYYIFTRKRDGPDQKPFKLIYSKL